MDLLNIALSALGSIASIVAFVTSIRRSDLAKIKVLYLMVSILAVSTSVTSYLYAQEVNEKLDIEFRKGNVKAKAKKIVSGVGFIDKYNPGENVGLMFSTLTLLEDNREFYPDLYQTFKDYHRTRIKLADEVDENQKRKILEEGAETALQMLKNISE